MIFLPISSETRDTFRAPGCTHNCVQLLPQKEKASISRLSRIFRPLGSIAGPGDDWGPARGREHACAEWSHAACIACAESPRRMKEI